jgi:hypothetical protein
MIATGRGARATESTMAPRILVEDAWRGAPACFARAAIATRVTQRRLP